MTLYKLTDENGQTRGGLQWGAGVTHSAQGAAGQPLCTDGWLHAYEHPLLAVLMNPAHGAFKNPQMWEAVGEVGARDGQLKCGCRTLTTVRSMAVPEVTTLQRVRFAVGCAWSSGSATWRNWAVKWLDGSDRSPSAAADAADAADAAARAAAYAAARAADAAYAAAYAAAAARDAAYNVDFIGIAEWALTDSLVPPAVVA